MCLILRLLLPGKTKSTSIIATDKFIEFFRVQNIPVKDLIEKTELFALDRKRLVDIRFFGRQFSRILKCINIQVGFLCSFFTYKEAYIPEEKVFVIYVFQSEKVLKNRFFDEEKTAL